MKLVRTVGSDEKADILLSGKYIPPLHATLTEDDGHTYIEDLNSTFGTHLNGRKTDRRTELSTNDKVRLGPLLFHWKVFLKCLTYNCFGRRKQAGSGQLARK